MARSRNRAAREKDKLRRRQQRQQIVLTFKYCPVDNIWRAEKHAELSLQSQTSFTASLPATPSISLTSPVAFRKITPDGNCFFRSLSFVITGNEEHYHLLRQNICNFIRINNDGMNSLLPAESKRDTLSYLNTSNMYKDKTWASEVEIYAASMLLKTNIYLYTQHGVHWKWIRYTSELNTSEKGIYLYHKNRNHFDVVVAIENSFVCNEWKRDGLYYFAQDRNRIQKAQKNAYEKVRYATDENYKQRKTANNQQRYQHDLIYSENKKKKAKVSYTCDPLLRKRKQESSSHYRNKRYKVDNVFKKKVQKASKQFQSRKYSTDTQFRNKKKFSQSEKYKSDVTYKDKQKQRSKEYQRKKYKMDVSFKQHKQYFSKLKQKQRYISDALFRKKLQQISLKKYASNMVFRNKSKQYSKYKYSRNVEFRDKTKQYSKDKYRTFSSFRNNVNPNPNVKKYATSPLFKSRLKGFLKTKYHSSKIIQETKKARVSKSRQSLIKSIQKFHKDIKDTPKYICTVCIRILYKSQVKLCQRERYSTNGTLNKNAQECLTGAYIHNCEDSKCIEDCVLKFLSRDKEWICHNCDRYLKQQKMPPQSLQNNLSIPPIPEVLAKLNELERQLIALRIPFVKLLSLPRGGQKGVKGPVVNVPSDLTTVTTTLPRNFNDAQLIKVKLKRKLQYKGHYNYKWINPTNVLTALRIYSSTIFGMTI